MSYQREPLVINTGQISPTLHNLPIALEGVCPDCKGTGYEDDAYLRIRCSCDNCDGRGTVLNDNGRAVLMLVATYLKSKDSDVLLAKDDI